MPQGKDEDVSVAKVVAEAEAIKKLLEESLEEEDEDYKLDDVKASYAELKKQNEELESYVEEALQEAHKLKEENQRLNEAHSKALLQLQLQEADSLEARSLVIESHEKEMLEQKLVETAVQVEELTNQLKCVEAENDALVIKLQQRQKLTLDAQREADRAKKRVYALEEEVTRLGLLKAEIRRLKAFEESAQEVEKLRSEVEQLRQLSSRPSTSDAEQPTPLPAYAPAVLPRAVAQEPFQPGQMQDVRNASAAVSAMLLSDDCSNLVRSTVASLLDHVAALGTGYETLLQERDKACSELAEFSRPSAWAKRDQQYTLDKQRWEKEAMRYRERIAVLQSENQVFREANKTAEYEARIQELQEQIIQLNEERTAALHEVHELKLQLAPVSGTFVSDNAKADAKAERAHLEDSDSQTTSGRTMYSGPTHNRQNGVSNNRSGVASFQVPGSEEAVIRVADTLQRFRSKGFDTGTLHQALQYYAAPANSTVYQQTPREPPPDVLSSSDFHQVLKWLQEAGVGPEDVSSYLHRQKELSRHTSPLHSRNTSSLLDGSQTAGGSAVGTTTGGLHHAASPIASRVAGNGSVAVSSPRVVQAVRHFKADGYQPTELYRYMAMYSHMHGSVEEDVAEDMTSELAKSRFSKVRQYLEEQSIGPEEVHLLLESNGVTNDQQHIAIDASWQDHSHSVSGLSNFGQVMNYFQTLGLPASQVQLGFGAYVRLHLLDCTTSAALEDTATDRIVSHLEAQRVDPAQVAHHVLGACAVSNSSAAPLQLLQAVGQPTDVIAALQRYASQSSSLPPNYELTASLLQQHAVGAHDVECWIQQQRASPQLLACLADLEDHGIPHADAMHTLTVHRAITSNDGLACSKELEERVISMCRQGSMQPNQVLQWLVDAAAAGDGAGLQQADMLQLLWAHQKSDEHAEAQPTPRVADALHEQPAGQRTQASPVLGSALVLASCNTELGSPISSEVRSTTDLKPGMEQADSSAAATHTAESIANDARLPVSVSPSVTQLTQDSHKAAVSRDGVRHDQLKQLRNDPNQLAHMLLHDSISSEEREALQLLQEIVDLQGKVDVLQQQVVKMQNQLAQADDVTFQIEDEIDAALSASHGDQNQTLENLRSKMQHLRLEAQLSKEVPSSPLAAVELDNELAVLVAEKILRVKQRLRIATDKRLSDGLDGNSAWSDMLQSLTEIEAEAAKLRDENHVLMQQLVSKKIEYAELQEENMITKRALVRAKEKQAQLSKKIDDIRDMPSLNAQTEDPDATPSSPTPTTTAKRRIAMFRAGRAWMTAANGAAE